MSEEEAKGFQFPGAIEVTAMGTASLTLCEVIITQISAAGAEPDPNSTRTRESKAGSYLSVTVSCFCATREHYEAVHANLRAIPEIKWTI